VDLVVRVNVEDIDREEDEERRRQEEEDEQLVKEGIEPEELLTRALRLMVSPSLMLGSEPAVSREPSIDPEDPMGNDLIAER
jgi:hypothetical protein